MKKFIKELIKKIFFIFPSSVVLMLHTTSNAKDQLSKDHLFKLLNTFNNWASLSDVVEKSKKHKLVLTFDDGSEDVYNIIYPYLKEKSIPFTIFVTYNFLDCDGCLSKAQLIELSKDPLVTIGGHCLNHTALASLSEEEQRKEICASKTCLESLIGIPIKYIAYPYGQYNKTTLNILRKTKAYSYAFIAGGNCVNAITQLFRFKLPRMNMRNDCFEKNMHLLKKYITKNNRF